MSSNISPVSVVANTSFNKEKKQEEQPKETATQSDNSGKILAGLAALGAIGIATVCLIKNRKASIKGSGDVLKKPPSTELRPISDDLQKANNLIPSKDALQDINSAVLPPNIANVEEKTPKELLEEFSYNLSLKPHSEIMPDIEKMILHEDDTIRLNSLDLLLYKNNLAPELLGKITKSLMMKTTEVQALQGSSVLNNNSLLVRLLQKDGTAKPAFLSNVIDNLSQADELSKLHVATTFVSNSDILKKLTPEQLEKISVSLDNVKLKKFDLHSGYLSTKKCNADEVKLVLKSLVFQKSDLKDKSIKMAKQVVDNNEISEEARLGFIENIFDKKLKDNNGEKAHLLIKDLLDKTLEMQTVHFDLLEENPTFNLRYTRDKFGLVKDLYDCMGNQNKSLWKPDEKLSLIVKMKKLFEDTPQNKVAGSYDELFSGLHKHSYNGLLIEELAVRRDVFAQKYPKHIPVEELEKYTDEMLGLFAKSKKSLQSKAFLGESDKLYLNMEFMLFSSDAINKFNHVEMPSSYSTIKAQKRILEKIQKCGEKHFGHDYSKYEQKSESGQSSFNFNEFVQDKAKESKKYISDAVAGIDDDNIKGLVKKMHDGSLNSDELKDLKKKLSIKFHPDKFQDAEAKAKAEETMKMLNNHLDMLKSTIKN